MKPFGILVIFLGLLAFSDSSNPTIETETYHYSVRFLVFFKDVKTNQIKFHNNTTPKEMEALKFYFFNRFLSFLI